jgi:hypothetical protein
MTLACKEFVISFLLDEKNEIIRRETWVNVVKIFTVVIYCHFIAILSFFPVKLFYLCNCHGMADNYHDIVL